MLRSDRPQHHNSARGGNFAIDLEGEVSARPNFAVPPDRETGLLERMRDIDSDSSIAACIREKYVGQGTNS
jgi:hypothetical protein